MGIDTDCYLYSILKSLERPQETKLPMAQDQHDSPIFAKLPLEIRELIYMEYFGAPRIGSDFELKGHVAGIHPQLQPSLSALPSTCSQMYAVI